MFRLSTARSSIWALSAAQFGFLSPIALGALIVPWFVYKSYVAMITASDKTLDAVSPENTIIIFDLHGVLFKSDVLGMINFILMSPCAGIILVKFLNPFFLYDIIRLYSHNYIAEYYFIYLAKHYESLQPCLPILFKAANQQIPAWKTIDLVRQLKQRGYTVQLFSNIGEHLFADLQEQYPDIFTLFDTITIGSRTNNYLGKPHPSVFYNYIITHPANGKQRLLIDDHARNIAFARAFNFAGIRYTSAATLQKFFKAHGIL